MKTWRQKKILEIVQKQTVETQEELARALRETGFKVTQATVSRDIKELGLVKVPGDKGFVRYATSDDIMARPSDERLKRLFRDSVTGVDYSENLIIIKTLPGEAQGVASAIDRSRWPEIIGTVGGDDTILVIIKPKKSTLGIVNRFTELARR
jgi:transcriptional regulator of arginine metabolism